MRRSVKMNKGTSHYEKAELKDLTTEEKLRLHCGEGFRNLYGAAGETKRVTVRLGISSFGYWSAAEKRAVTDDGVYEVVVAKSSAEECRSVKVVIQNGKIRKV